MKLRNVQALRASASLAVILFHLGFPGASLGEAGVDLFFVISGFIMIFITPKPLDSLIAEIGPFFTPWKIVNLPYFTEGIDETPVVGGTHGSIDTNNLFPGGVEFSANPDDGESVQPTVKKWWRHSWTIDLAAWTEPGALAATSHAIFIARAINSSAGASSWTKPTW